MGGSQYLKCEDCGQFIPVGSNPAKCPKCYARDRVDDYFSVSDETVSDEPIKKKSHIDYRKITMVIVWVFLAVMALIYILQG